MDVERVLGIETIDYVSHVEHIRVPPLAVDDHETSSIDDATRA